MKCIFVSQCSLWCILCSNVHTVGCVLCSEISSYEIRSTSTRQAGRIPTWPPQISNDVIMIGPAFYSSVSQFSVSCLTSLSTNQLVGNKPKHFMSANAIIASDQFKSSHRNRAYSAHYASRFHESPKQNSKLAVNAKHGRTARRLLGAIWSPRRAKRTK